MSRDLDRQSSRSSRPHDFLIKLRGIPFTSTKEDIKRFLSRQLILTVCVPISDQTFSFTACRHVAIHLFSNSGSSSGECLVDLQSDADVRDALNKDREFMGKRYIEGKRQPSTLLSTHLARPFSLPRHGVRVQVFRQAPRNGFLARTGDSHTKSAGHVHHGECARFLSRLTLLRKSHDSPTVACGLCLDV